ncbi:fumarylacetoacetate (FAA) hydrolase [Sphingomonas vulcanisoli]|uniref:Fumarylacetoacetate (FAA) hydrolase n=1 Tax=Sphingomonas vulcanisoli TaxID=1658060 RepID=A0ABX0TQ66_9SPHN|nr:fumarylacetoacetate hydrolase family protein [Sphingomonas vulcanisoli]NIJ06755.1 fumarylacetoacetate (FAA) hydrolase [Sphingomonas vulcanisoli]
MKLATVPDGTRDGALVIVARDLSRAVPAGDIAATVQDALDRWDAVQPALAARFAALEAGSADGAVPFDPATALAPLPRAWQWLDGSAFESHGDLMQAVFGLEPNPKGRPLMYQGMSDTFLAPTQDAAFPSEADGIDFEGEFGVIVDAVPLGVTAADAERHIRLVVQINDWSLRAIAPIEMKTGFGWIQAKPASSMAPVAVTPDELGAAWRDGRVDLPLVVDWNGVRFGTASGYPMAFSLPELVAHAARTRALCAGTIIGTGTVSNANFREVGSSCIAERRGIELLDEGAPRTPFMRFGDRVRMEARTTDDAPLFGAIDQSVVAAK